MAKQTKLDKLSKEFGGIYQQKKKLALAVKKEAERILKCKVVVDSEDGYDDVNNFTYPKISAVGDFGFGIEDNDLCEVADSMEAVILVVNRLHKKEIEATEDVVKAAFEDAEVHGFVVDDCVTFATMCYHLKLDPETAMTALSAIYGLGNDAIDD